MFRNMNEAYSFAKERFDESFFEKLNEVLTSDMSSPDAKMVSSQLLDFRNLCMENLKDHYEKEKEKENETTL